MSALTDRFFADFLKSLYLSSHKREMACNVREGRNLSCSGHSCTSNRELNVDFYIGRITKWYFIKQSMWRTNSLISFIDLKILNTLPLHFPPYLILKVSVRVCQAFSLEVNHCKSSQGIWQHLPTAVTSIENFMGEKIWKTSSNNYRNSQHIQFGKRMAFNFFLS